MRSVLKYAVSLLIIVFISSSAYAAHGGAPSPKKEEKKSEAPSTSRSEKGQVNLGGAKGPGTEAVHFDDESLISTPVPTSTPNYSFKTPEIEVWQALTDTKSMINRSKKDLVRYEATFRKDFMKSLNEMGSVVASMHTEGLVDKRDQVEFAWEEKVDGAEHSLALAEEWNNEFKEEYKLMGKNQRRVEELLRKFRLKIMRTDEVMKKHESNKEEMFFLKKDLDKFNNLFESYVQKYQDMVRTKDERVNKLLNDHYELYKP